MELPVSTKTINAIPTAFSYFKS